MLHVGTGDKLFEVSDSVEIRSLELLKHQP